MVQFRRSLALLWLYIFQSTSAIDVDWGNPDSVKSAASTIAAGMMSYYVGNEYGQTPGILPGPYYWWEAGAMWGAMIEYWHYTNDSQYNDLITQALQWQVGPHDDYMPPNASASLGNDDQAFWGMAALAAAEYKFPNPLPSQPSWLSLAQAVFNEQVGRWDTVFCNGGIRWQIYQITGWDLKNSISNGCLFNMASRLARYTGDDQYAQWAVKIWDWMWRIGLIDNDNYSIYDNAEADRQNCSIVDHTQWCYNAGTMLMGASTMWNITGDELWRNRTANILSTLAFDYFPDGIMKDICEQNNACDVDQHSFKAYLSRWMAAATQMAPFTYATSAPLLLSSAKAAVAQCIGAPTGNVCGLKWYLNGTWDGTAGVGQQMAALEVVLGTMVSNASVAVTNSTGGTSPSNPSAGYNASDIPPGEQVTPPSKADRAGAWFLTALFSLGALYLWWFMNTSSWEWSAATIGGKPGRKGRTVSTINMPGAGVPGDRSSRNGKSPNVLTKPDHRASTGIFPTDRERAHVRTGSFLSEKGVGFPSDRERVHVRSGSFGSEKGPSFPSDRERAPVRSGSFVSEKSAGGRLTSLSGLAPIVESGRNDVADPRRIPIYKGGELPT